MEWVAPSSSSVTASEEGDGSDGVVDVAACVLVKPRVELLSVEEMTFVAWSKEAGAAARLSRKDSSVDADVEAKSDRVKPADNDSVFNMAGVTRVGPVSKGVVVQQASQDREPLLPVTRGKTLPSQRRPCDNVVVESVQSIPVLNRTGKKGCVHFTGSGC